MLSNPADMAITRAIIALGHTLGLKIVAEGAQDPVTAHCRRWPWGVRRGALPNSLGCVF